MQDPDHILVERLRNKDKRAFELVFNDFFGLMKSYAMRFMDEVEEAEEIVQDVFVKFWEKCDTLAPDSSVKSYLYRSVHNTCLNYLKHQKVKDSYRQYVMGFMQEAVESSYEPEKPDLEKRIMEEINALPPRCSEIFKLSRFEGLKYQEIADHLEISIKTVEVQMGKALKVLRDRLHDLRVVE
ncbi:RNA polymerase sigma-70 factor [Marinoscillum sp.]|uniref:RNA polymerase sigma-70 factor n=1 Tax=Marinoscillum sp. TaxID=2024838 RepID=UPI003BAB0DE8